MAFTYTLDGVAEVGSIPISTASFSLDLQNIANSKVNVTLDARGIKAGFIIATQALKSGDMMNVAAHPRQSFRSTKISGNLNNGRIQGNLTIKGITKPVTLRGQVLRQAGSAAGDTSKLVIKLSGTFKRADFAMQGYPNLVGPTISLDIVVGLIRSDN